ncbi:hypothetical protein [Nonomuraea aurantiaca]|uniref:hypothetical protein n=1 Tax=Nonomuraea aurantiaca TaxID=2878562 RepID=UPI001CD91E49|nr:hypothetical protein [Nonomuraea aurantiaca]MCA2229434.1 hypothetical protein [Nonomuraea aurantiaca]
MTTRINAASPIFGTDEQPVSDGCKRAEPCPIPALQLLSLGAGVQPPTLLLLSIYGDVSRFEAAIFADERSAAR